MDAPRPAAAAGYHRIGEIASGGMGRVDLVVRREGRFARAYAMKRLHEAYELDPQIRASFLDEARIAGLVRDIHVVSVLDVGSDDEGAWLVMELVEGLSLSELLVRLGVEGSQLPVPACIEIARQAALGLHAAHEVRGSGGKLLGVVHRDVSPQNILVGFDGVVRVTDFGVARAVDATMKTRTGVLKGKYGYMAPEQLRMDRLDHRTDLYALGVVLFEALTGRKLRSGEPLAIRYQVLHGAPPDVEEYRPDLPPSLVELLFELMAPEPEMRPADAREVARRLDGIARELDDDDVVDLGTFVSERFAEDREAQKARLSHALEEGSEHYGIESPAIEPISEATTVLIDTQEAPPPGPPTGSAARDRRSPAWPLLFALLLVLAGAALAFFAFGSPEPAGTARAVPPAGVADPTSGGSAEPGPGNSVSPATERAADLPARPSTAEADAADEPAASPRRPSRRRSRPRATTPEPAAEATETPAVPSWEWD